MDKNIGQRVHPLGQTVHPSLPRDIQTSSTKSDDPTILCSAQSTIAVLSS